VRRVGKDEIMKISRRTNDVDMQEEYDFSQGVRGKYAKEYAKGTNIAILDPEVAKVFHNSRSVNEALRSLLPIIRNHATAR